jgi:hypothetical protein
VISTAWILSACTESLTHPVGSPCRINPISKATSVSRESSLKALTVIESESDGPTSPASSDTLVTPLGNLSKNEGHVNGCVLIDLVPSQGTSVKDPSTTPLVVLLGPISILNPRVL